MIYSSFRCCLGPLYILSKAVSYICSYFRAPDSRRSRQLVVPQPVSIDHIGHVIPQNHLAYLFLREENADFPVSVEALPSISPVIDYKEPGDQAVFLKACGVLLETPESHNMPRSLDVSDHDSEDPVSSSSHQWNFDVEISEELSGSFENTANRCNSNGSDKSDESCSTEITPTSDVGMQDGVRPVLTEKSLNSGFPTPNVPNRNKSVHFEFDKDQYFGTHPSEGLENIENQEHDFESNSSPYPTPLKIEDGMQTPGTAFPANARNLRNTNIFIKSRHFYPDFNQVENIPQSKADTGESTDVEKSCRKKGHFDHTVEVILGSKEPEKVKWWEGNGIPNSTKKYMEDQKVCYHATPFEERLEKAILEDSFIPHKTNGGVLPLIFEE